MKLDQIVDCENQVIPMEELYISISVSVTGLTYFDTSIPSLFLQCLYKVQGLSLQYLHKVIITILCLHYLYKNTSTVIRILSLLQVSLRMSLREDILHHLYKGIFKIMILLLSLHTSLQSEFL